MSCKIQDLDGIEGHIDETLGGLSTFADAASKVLGESILGDAFQVYALYASFESGRAGKAVEEGYSEDMFGRAVTGMVAGELVGATAALGALIALPILGFAGSATVGY
jgi:hypothetical protein